MYKLLQVWDAPSIEHLAQYFPVLEPRQSKELRAGYFKVLSDIKNKGVFPKDIVVRRTMLEECKGPKFEELLGCLSSMALAKSVVEEQEDGSIAKRVVLGEYDGKAVQQALNLAYRYDCNKTIKQREAYEKRWTKFGRSLKGQKEELEGREKDIDFKSRQRREKVIPQRTLHRLRRHAQENWKGDQEWVNTLLRSDQHRPQGRLLERDFVNVWGHACEDTLYAIRPQKNDSLLQNLERRVGEQNSRLEKWKLIRERLTMQAQAMLATDEEAQDTPPAIEGISTPNDWTNAENSRSITKSTHARQSSRHLDQREYAHPPFSSSSTAYSPVKATKTPSATDAGSSYFPPEHYLPPSPTRRDYSHLRTSSMPQHEMEPRHQSPHRYSPIRRPIQDVNPPSPEKTTFLPADEETAATPVTNCRAPQMNMDQLPPQLSLAERTRMSMARYSPIKNDMPPPPTLPSPQKETPEPVAQIPTTPDRIQTLAERTRQSMSLMSAQPGKHHRKSRVSRVSNVYPTNQFETPRKPGNYAVETPLFDETLEDLDAEAVFKSRPRIAVSPVMGPAEGFGGIEEMALEDGNRSYST